MSNSVDPDETAHYEPSHLDLRCLQKSIIIVLGRKELRPYFALSGLILSLQIYV